MFWFINMICSDVHFRLFSGNTKVLEEDEFLVGYMLFSTSAVCHAGHSCVFIFLSFVSVLCISVWWGLRVELFQWGLGAARRQDECLRNCTYAQTDDLLCTKNARRVKVAELSDREITYSERGFVAWDNHTHTQLFYGPLDFVQDNLGEPIPKETFTHSHSSASCIYYDPWHPPYSIHVLYSLFPQSLSKFSLVCVLAWHPPLHTPYISSPNLCLLFATHAHTIATCLL